MLLRPMFDSDTVVVGSGLGLLKDLEIDLVRVMKIGSFIDILNN